MPLQLYEKEQILDACLAVFAENGYENTTTAMLAEAAGISKALIFHHFKSKKELYLSLLDRSIEVGKGEIDVDSILKAQDFFKAKEDFSIIKFNYYRKNPNVYKIGREAFYETPEELKEELAFRYGNIIEKKEDVWRKLFDIVILREGVDRDQAFKLIMITLDYFEGKYLSELTGNYALDQEYFQQFIEERRSFLNMIRFGIEENN